MPDWFDQFAVLNRHPTFCPAMDELGYKTLKECYNFSIVGNKLVPQNKIPIISCGECPYFVVYNWEDYDDSDLVMHHKDFNPKNNERTNLMTLCRHCNGLKKYSKPNLKKYLFQEEVNEHG